jgi:protein-tyrosine phosphatase
MLIRKTTDIIEKLKMKGSSQDIKFRALLNFRDIGGISGPGKSIIRRGVVFRSANPDTLPGSDIEMLRSLNIRTIVDLRAPHELSRRYKSIDHAVRISLPLDFQQTTRERLRPVIYKKDAETVISDISNDIYLEILDASGSVLKHVMEILASPEGSPVLIHCQAGKDRTGIIVALVLLAMGVERQLIINDFMKSNDSLIPYFKKRFRIRKLISFGFFPYANMIYAVMVKQRNIESILDRVEFHYGGIEGYLGHAGIEKSDIEQVRSALLKEDLSL